MALLFWVAAQNRGFGALERVLAALAGADADRFLDGGDEDLSVADAAGARDGRDRLDDVADDARP